MAGVPHFEILHIVGSLEGGAARHILYLSKELRGSGHRIAVAAPFDHPSVKTELEGNGFTFFELPKQPLASIQKIVSIINDLPFTHVHVHGHRAAFLGRMAKDRANRKVALIYTVHGYHPMYYQNPASRWIVNGIERILAHKTDAYICVSPSTYSDLVKTVPEIESRCHIVENGIPFNLLNPEEFSMYRMKGRKEYKIAEEGFVIGTVARLHWQKGISRLVQAFKSVQTEYPNTYLMIVGDGPEKKSLNKLAKSLELGPNCIFAGKFSEMNRIYPIMDMFVLPSHWEGLPLTILESWNAGIPVVATDVSGSRELIEDGITGFLAENSVDGIAESIRRAIQSSNDFAGIIQNAQKRLRENYSLEQMGQKTEAIYQLTSLKN